MPLDRTIIAIFEAQVSQTPNATAVVYKDQQLTYAELNRRANRLASFLRKLHVGPETLVGVFMQRSLEMVVSLYGILKAGGAYVPLDPEYPAGRVAFMVEDTKVPVVLTQSQLIEKLSTIQNLAASRMDAEDPTSKLICLDSDWAAIARESDENVDGGATPENLAYVIYTSGSTGQPKGVMNEHRGICNRLLWMQEAYALTQEDRVLQKTPFSFDVSVWEFFWPLMFGAQLVIAEPEGHKDSQYLVQQIVEHAITTIHFVPSMLAVFLLDKDVETCLSLKRVICSGEALSFSLQQRFFARLDAELHNLYGPTEAAVDVTYWACQRDSERTTVPIGRPVTNTQLYLLDKQLRPVPVGEPGELHIGGVQVARGYLNRPELTEEKFIPDPFSNDPDARLYKTGDLARSLPDGNIVYLGRLDHQVKIRGNRIELGEIEAAISQHPCVRDVVVVAREDTPGDKRLVAYFVPVQQPVPENGQSPAQRISALRSHLKDILPAFMIPSAYLMLETLPLTHNGKVNRRALPAPSDERQMITDYVAPRNAVERKLAAIWSQVIGISSVGINDNFFELGGDSILGIQMMSEANQLGIYFTPDQLFRYPTVAQLAGIAGTAPMIQAEQGLVSGPLPLTPIQHWFFEQKLAEPHHWNQAFLFNVRQALNPLYLEQAIQHLQHHHDALRLRFTSDESGWRQVVDATIESVPFLRLDLSTLSAAEQTATIESTATELQASLRLSEGPLMSVALFETGPEEPCYLLMSIHHLATDIVSWRILLEDLALVYQQLNNGQKIQLPPKTTSYKHWAERLTHYAQSEALQNELPYWLERQKEGVSPLPVDYPQGMNRNTEATAGTIATSLDAEKTRILLKEVPKAYQTHINDVLLTALAQALSQWTGRSSQLIDLEGHGREAILDDVDLLRTVGWFTALFPVSLRIDVAEGPGDRLKSIKEQLRRIPNRGIGYGLLRYLNKNTAIGKQLQILPQADLRFNYLGQFDPFLSSTSPFTFTNHPCGPMRSLRGNRSHLLDIEGMVIEGRLQVIWNYSKEIHRPKTIDQLAHHFMDALEELIHHCQSPNAGGFTPSDFPEADLSQKELDELLSEISEL